MSQATTLGELRASGWISRPVKDELRSNAVVKIAAGEPLFDGVMGYEHTVLPQLENAILAGHDVIFLGERGQAKTRMIRSLTNLLDEWMPIIAGSEIYDDPYHPISKYAKDLIAENGDATRIDWVHRDDRFGEINPDAEERCDLFDNNCDGQIDEGFDEDRDGARVCTGLE